MNIDDKIVFHGTTQELGTNAKIKAPSLRNPFFVGSTLEIAKSYIDTESESVFIFLLKDSPKKLAINLADVQDISKISSSLPNSAKAISYWISTGFHRLFSKSSTSPNFWNFIVFLNILLKFINENNTLPKKDDKAMGINFNDQKMIHLAINMLKELHLIEIKDGHPYISNNELKIKIEQFTTIESKLFHEAGRIIKEPINKAIFNLGYFMVGDNDSGMLSSKGMEYAVLSKSVFAKVWSESINAEDVNEIENAISYLLGKSLKKSLPKINSNDDLNQYLSNLFKSIYRIKKDTIPYDIRNELKEITIPDEIGIIDSGAFENCMNLEKITINNGTYDIKSGAFKKCPKLKVIHLGNGIQPLPNNLFKNITTLEKIYIPKSIPSDWYENTGINSNVKVIRY